MAKKQDWKSLFKSSEGWLNITDTVLSVVPLMYKEDPELMSLYNKYMTRNFDSDEVLQVTAGFTSNRDNPFDRISFYDESGAIFKLQPSDISMIYSNVVSQDYVVDGGKCLTKGS